MTTLSELELIRQELEALHDVHDPEVAHSDADDLLVKALRTLADSVTKSLVEDIIEAYGDVPKRFA